MYKTRLVSFEQFLGSLYGLAVGDAFGTSVEFKTRGTFQPVTEMIGGGVFSLSPGQWTDDTSMALCLAESLIDCNDMDLINQLEKYSLWYENGYLSSTGKCFDIGNTVRLAIEHFKMTKDPYSGSKDQYSAGNGSIMRLAPVSLLYSYNLNECLKMSAESSKTTHQAQESIDGCELLGSLIYGAMQQMSKEELLSTTYTQFVKTQTGSKWSSNIEEIANGSYKNKDNADIKSSGYVVHTLEAALWAFFHTSTFTEGLIKVVNLGDDADTTGAVYGQLAGAYYGVNNIPKKWIDQLACRDKIEDDATRLFQLHSTLREER